MRFTYLELNNYIGIYNGMGLYQIKIDFSKAFHRVCVIKGTNGSGKSTIQNALSLFPDSNESFIPDKSASKIVRVLYKGEHYEAKFYHDLRTSGVRVPTKAFISKYDPSTDNWMELNSSGNVTSYKEILYDIFKLDSNFFALTKLSMDDRGIGYKRPADRKRFVNSIIESLEVYNDIYKAITKKATATKAVMNNITSRLGSIGDKDSLNQMMKSIEDELSSLQDQRDKINARIAQINLNINTIDPDSSIQELHKNVSASLKQVNATLQKLITGYQSDNKLFIPEVESKLLGEKLDKAYKDILFFEKELERLKANATSIIDQISVVRSQLDLTVSQLDALKTDEYIETENELLKVSAQASEIADLISVTGIDPMAFTASEYKLALETVHEIVSMVDLFRSSFEYDMIQRCISDYKSSNYTRMPDVLTCQAEINLIQNQEKDQAYYLNEIAKATSDLQIASMLEHRPAGCTIDTCYFISDAVKASATNPKERLDKYNSEYESYKQNLANAYSVKEFTDTYNLCINQIRTIVRSIDKNQSILSRLPNGGIFGSKTEFFEMLVGGQSFQYIDRLYQYLNIANYFEQYQILQQTIQRYKERLNSLASKRESMIKFEEAKQTLIYSIEELTTKLSCNQSVISDVNKALQSAKSYASYLNDVVIPRCDQIIDGITKRNEYREKLATIQTQIADISDYINRRNECASQIRVIDSKIEYKRKERSDIEYKLRQIADYEKSLAEYKEVYDKYYEKIKYYSSPTTGIQLVFMQLYMGKILDVSNRLLSYLFGGQFQLQPFIINEDEFRIPCLGNGYLNDDISSMSSSQLTMISMILSFALMTVSSTEYNIIKLDEIDDPLDEPNRAAFALLLDNIMDVMHTEQCIMISHSSEMITSNVDIILLKSDGLISVSSGDNIIWNFNNQ